MLKNRIIPCLDVKNGRVVKGINFVDLKDAGDPVEQASIYDKGGADEICFLDITASNENRSTIINVVSKTAEKCFVPLTVGGGIRTIDTIEKYISHGVDRIILGTKVLKNKEFILSLDKSIRQRIAIDIAVKDGKLAGDGWEKTESENIKSFIEYLEINEIKMFIITDISKDGMMKGISKNSINSILNYITTSAIISGGVTTMDDVRTILSMDKSKINGMIIGKALYEDSIDLSEAIDECS